LHKAVLAIQDSFTLTNIRNEMVKEFRIKLFSPLILTRLLDTNDSCAITFSAIESLRHLQNLTKFSRNSLLPSKSKLSNFIRDLSQGSEQLLYSSSQQVLKDDNFCMLSQWLIVESSLIYGCGSSFDHQGTSYYIF